MPINHGIKCLDGKDRRAAKLHFRIDLCSWNSMLQRGLSETYIQPSFLYIISLVRLICFFSHLPYVPCCNMKYAVCMPILGVSFHPCNITASLI